MFFLTGQYKHFTYLLCCVGKEQKKKNKLTNTFKQRNLRQLENKIQPKLKKINEKSPYPHEYHTDPIATMT